jgi:hypothetical protein
MIGVFTNAGIDLARDSCANRMEWYLNADIKKKTINTRTTLKL